MDISHAVAEAILSMRSPTQSSLLIARASSTSRTPVRGVCADYSPDEAISRSLDFIIPAGKTFPHSGQSDAKLPRFNRKMERKWLI